MDWIIHNPIGDMSGPKFLGIYACLIAVTAVACDRFLRGLDTTDGDGPPPVPIDPDPYELAYLRGGINETIRTVGFSLLGRGYVDVVEVKKRRGVAATSMIWRKDDRPPTPG